MQSKSFFIFWSKRETPLHVSSYSLILQTCFQPLFCLTHKSDSFKIQKRARCHLQLFHFWWCGSIVQASCKKLAAILEPIQRCRCLWSPKILVRSKQRCESGGERRGVMWSIYPSFLLCSNRLDCRFFQEFYWPSARSRFDKVLEPTCKAKV